MSSEQLRNLIDAIPDDFAAPAADYQAVRAMFAPFHGHPVSDGLSIERVELGGVSCARYALPGLTSAWTAFHCHGGAFVSTRVEEYHFYAELIATQTGCNVIMPDYRLAPETTFPAAHDDCFNAYCGALDTGVDPDTLVFMGESCGGSLALATLVRARDAGLPMPAAFVSLTGWFDLAVSGEPVAGQDPFLTPQWVRNRGREYLGLPIVGDNMPGEKDCDYEALAQPTLSPAFADLQGLPPLYLQVGQQDTLREGQLLLGVRAARSGVKVTLESWPGAIHGWHGLLSAQVPEAEAAWEAIRRYIESLHS